MSDTWTTEFQPIILAAMVSGDALAGITVTGPARFPASNSAWS